MSLRPTRRDWPDAIGVTGLTIAAVSSIGDHDWWALLWICIAAAYLVSSYIGRKTTEVWKALYYTAKDRADRATWGGHLS